MIYSTAELATLSRAYMVATGTAASRLGRVAAGHNRLIERLLAGGYDPRATSLERASAWFDENWPDSIPWPLEKP